MSTETSGVLIIDPVTNTTDTTALVEFPQMSKWLSAGYCPLTGTLYAPPHGLTTILSVGLTPRTRLPSRTHNGERVVGCHLCVRHRKAQLAVDEATTLLVVDPATNASALIPIAGAVAEEVAREWRGIALAPNKLYSPTTDGASVLITDPFTNTRVLPSSLSVGPPWT